MSDVEPKDGKKRVLTLSENSLCITTVMFDYLLDGVDILNVKQQYFMEMEPDINQQSYTAVKEYIESAIQELVTTDVELERQADIRSLLKKIREITNDPEATLIQLVKDGRLTARVLKVDIDVATVLHELKKVA